MRVEHRIKPVGGWKIAGCAFLGSLLGTASAFVLGKLFLG